MNLLNPYYEYISHEPQSLIGREFLVQTILSGLTDARPRSFQVVGFRSMGGSSLLRFIARIHNLGGEYRRHLKSPFSDPLRLSMLYIDAMSFPEGRSLTPWLLQQLQAHEAFSRYQMHPVDGDSPVALMQELIDLAEQDRRRIVILLDHFDRALKQLPKEEATLLRPLVGAAGFVTATEHPLVKLNQDAASSWFGNMLYQLNLEPLHPEEARELLRAPAEVVDPRLLQELERVLLPLTGLHSSFILRGAAEWFELRRRYGTLPVDQLRDDIARGRLLHTFSPDFVRFWNHITSVQRESLCWLVESSSPANPPAKHQSRLDQLVDMGLVVWSNRKRAFEPFSQTWSEFIRQHSREDSLRVSSALQSPMQSTGDYTPRERNLLDYLRSNSGRICSYREILRKVWSLPDEPAHRHVLRQTVMRLRDKIRTSPFSDAEIINHKAKGYEYRSQ